MNLSAFGNNCPIREHTADGIAVGRCWAWLTDNKCPRHGDVTKAKERYAITGELIDEVALRDSPEEDLTSVNKD